MRPGIPASAAAVAPPALIQLQDNLASISPSIAHSDVCGIAYQSCGAGVFGQQQSGKKEQLTILAIAM